jgi:hypothetical protein
MVNSSTMTYKLPTVEPFIKRRAKRVRISKAKHLSADLSEIFNEVPQQKLQSRYSTNPVTNYITTSYESES